MIVHSRHLLDGCKEFETGLVQAVELSFSSLRTEAVAGARERKQRQVICFNQEIRLLYDCFLDMLSCAT
jgi:hypothetical protein